MTDQTRIVGYCDLLGFSQLVVSDIRSARTLLSDFYNMAQDTKVDHGYGNIDLFLFSDFLFVQGDDVSDVVNYLCTLYRGCLRYSATRSNTPLLCRGGIARGEVVTQARNQAPRVTKNFIVSPALTHAVQMEKLVKGQRLLISANEREELSHFWNSNLASITYAQPTIRPSKLFTAYRYQDLLWGRDLTKAYGVSKTEASELVVSAASLFKSNSKKARSISSHYAETLRICLLSYTSLLEPCARDRELLHELVRDTLLPAPDASVWLGFLEMVTTSRDAFAFHDDPSVIRFLQEAILSRQWGEVCGALSRPSEAHLRRAAQELISVAMHVPVET